MPVVGKNTAFYWQVVKQLFLLFLGMVLLIQPLPPINPYNVYKKTLTKVQFG